MEMTFRKEMYNISHAFQIYNAAIICLKIQSKEENENFIYNYQQKDKSFIKATHHRCEFPIKQKYLEKGLEIDKNFEKMIVIYDFVNYLDRTNKIADYIFQVNGYYYLESMIVE